MWTASGAAPEFDSEQFSYTFKAKKVNIFFVPYEEIIEEYETASEGTVRGSDSG